MNLTMSQSQLIALAEENHFSQLLEEIENIHRIDPAMAEKIAEIFNVSLSTQDDFEEIFDNTFVNILYFLWLNLLNVSLPYEVLLIFYEKYGGDPVQFHLSFGPSECLLDHSTQMLPWSIVFFKCNA